MRERIRTGSTIIIGFIRLHCMRSHTKEYMKQVKKRDCCESQARDVIIIYTSGKTKRRGMVEKRAIYVTTIMNRN